MIAKLLPLVCLAVMLLAGDAIAEPPAPADVDRWIEQLGSKQFTEREEASRRLTALDEVPAALREATGSPVPEIARRAKAAVETIERRRREQRTQQMLAEINGVGIDAFIDRMAGDKDFATDRRWQSMGFMADALAVVAGKLGSAGFVSPRRDWTTYPVATTLPMGGATQTRIRLAGMKDMANRVADCLIVSSQSIDKLWNGVESCIILVNGDVAGFNKLSNCLVFCNGNIGHMNAVENSIVLATGEIKGFTVATNSLIEAKSVEGYARTTGSVLVNIKPARFPRPGEAPPVQSDDSPLKALRFFDPVSLGLTTEPVEGGLRVKSVTATSPFAKAGVQPGDLLIGANKVYWNSPDEFRTSLRRKLSDESVTIQAVRGDRLLHLPVRLKD